MEFFDDFLKSNQKGDISMSQFLLEYDITHGTIYSLTHSYEELLLQMLNCKAKEFILQCNISHIPQVSKKIQFLMDEYIIFLTSQNINVAIIKTVSFLRKHDYIIYIKHIIYTSNLLWQQADVYDIDYNFITRRIKLARLLMKLYLYNLPIKNS